MSENECFRMADDRERSGDDVLTNLAWLAGHDAMAGVTEIIRERRAQVEFGLTAKHDDMHADGRLAVMASDHLTWVFRARSSGASSAVAETGRLRRAGALAAAEIDRLGRLNDVKERSGGLTPVTDSKPTVGRIVHYVSHGTPVREDGSQAYPSLCRAAVVTEVNDMDPVPEHGVPYVGLCVLNPTGQFFNRGVVYDEAGERGGSWHWPERAE